MSFLINNNAQAYRLSNHNKISPARVRRFMPVLKKWKQVNRCNWPILVSLHQLCSRDNMWHAQQLSLTVTPI